MEKYDEVRIEITTGELLKIMRSSGIEIPENYKHNNTFIAGHKDIGLNGWIIFILRKQELKNATTDQK